jgi:peptidoglycan/LPS O-acetylase OafA/YrhL
LGITAVLVRLGWGYISPFRILGATTGMAGVVFLAFALPRIPGAGLFSRVGVRSLEIYVVHVICIAGVRGVLISVFHVDQPLIHILAGIIGGIAGGVLAYQLSSAIGIDLFRAPFFSGANGRGKNGWRIRILSRG